jgi:RNA polymerase sigma-70 factor (ECF subfamily)
MQQATIEKLLSGDLDAYEEVVRQYQRMLLGYAANRLLDIDAAQEVVQLTFIRAYEQLNEYQPERDFGVWLCVICKHFILTELERQRRKSRNLEKFSHAAESLLLVVLAGIDSGTS